MNLKNIGSCLIFALMLAVSGTALGFQNPPPGGSGGLPTSGGGTGGPATGGSTVLFYDYTWQNSGNSIPPVGPETITDIESKNLSVDLAMQSGSGPVWHEANHNVSVVNANEARVLQPGDEFTIDYSITLVSEDSLTDDQFLVFHWDGFELVSWSGDLVGNTGGVTGNSGNKPFGAVGNTLTGSITLKNSGQAGNGHSWFSFTTNDEAAAAQTCVTSMYWCDASAPGNPTHSPVPPPICTTGCGDKKNPETNQASGGKFVFCKSPEVAWQFSQPPTPTSGPPKIQAVDVPAAVAPGQRPMTTFMA